MHGSSNHSVPVLEAATNVEAASVIMRPYGPEIPLKGLPHRRRHITPICGSRKPFRLRKVTSLQPQSTKGECTSQPQSAEEDCQEYPGVALPYGGPRHSSMPVGLQVPPQSMSPHLIDRGACVDAAQMNSHKTKQGTAETGPTRKVPTPARLPIPNTF